MIYDVEGRHEKNKKKVQTGRKIHLPHAGTRSGIDARGLVSRGAVYAPRLRSSPRMAQAFLYFSWRLSQREFPGARLAMGEFCGEHGRGDTIPVVLGCPRPADREVVPPPAPSMHRVLMGQARRRLPADAWREVSRFVLLPPGWLCVKTRYGNQGRTYTRYSSQDGKHKHLTSVRAVVRQDAIDKGEDPEAAVAQVSSRRKGTGRPVGTTEGLVLPAGWSVRYRVRTRGLKKGTRDRYLVTPDGVVLKSKQEMQAFLYLDRLEPQPPDHLRP